MDKELLKKIKTTVPDIPDEIVQLWLLPFAQKFGWPPIDSDDWRDKMASESIDFWNGASWKQTEIDPIEQGYSYICEHTIEGLINACVYGQQNMEARMMGADSKERFFRALDYMLQHGVFPSRPIVYKERGGRYSILDGSHRIASLVMSKQLNALPEEKLKEWKLFLKISNLVPPKKIQKIWLCEPNWSLSPKKDMFNILFPGL